MAQEEIQETQEEEERSDNGETPTQASENEEPMEDAPEKTEETPPAEEENSEASEQHGESGDEEGEEETFGIKLETAPNDIRFATTNQSRHCFTHYIEYHRCIAVKGEGAIECQKFAKYYRSLCPGEWIEAWNEQREQGIFPGPL